MRYSVTSDRQLKPPGGINKIVIIAVKLLVTGACFWYLSWQIDLGAVFSSIPPLELRWAALAIFMVTLQIPLVAMRWREILRVLGAVDARMTNTSIIVITAIGLFFARATPLMVLPGLIPLLDRGAYLRWMAGLAATARRVVLGPESFAILGL